jgi:hypothetical protein
MKEKNLLNQELNKEGKDLDPEGKNLVKELSLGWSIL